MDTHSDFPPAPELYIGDQLLTPRLYPALHQKAREEQFKQHGVMCEPYKAGDVTVSDGRLRIKMYPVPEIIIVNIDLADEPSDA